MLESRYRAFRRLINGKEETLNNGNRIVNGKIGNYVAQLELMRLSPSGYELLLDLHGSNEYGRRAIRHLELYENESSPTKIHTQKIENKDPEFQGKLEIFFNYAHDVMFRKFVITPSVFAPISYLILHKTLGVDPLSAIEFIIFNIVGFYSTDCIIPTLMERKESIKRIKTYNELKRLLNYNVSIQRS